MKFKIVDLTVGAQKFKPFEVTVAPHEGMTVEIPIPENLVEGENDDGSLIFKIEALTFVANRIAEQFDDIVTERESKKPEPKYLRRGD